MAPLHRKLDPGSLGLAGGNDRDQPGCIDRSERQCQSAGAFRWTDERRVAIARKILGEGRLIGVSTCSPEQGKAAARAGADLIGIGPIFPSRTKPKSSLLGPAGFKAYMDEPELSAFPHLAISGITAENVSELVSAGCRGIAVSAAICRSQDPAQAAAELRNAMAAGNRSG